MQIRFLLIPIFVTCLGRAGHAEVKPAAIFADGMVLQREMPVPVWGTAAAGEKVSVAVAGQMVETTAGPDGRWLVRLAAIKAGGPFELKIDGTNHLTVKDVLLGEVWVAGGQSNMEMHVDQSAGGAEAAAAANDTQIRFFKVGGALPFEPTRDFSGNWQTATPENVKSWSAAAYFFAKDLRAALGVPVGVIQNAVGWTPAEAWTSREALAAEPELKPIVDRWDHWTAAYPKAKEIYDHAHAQWQSAADAAKASGKPAPPEPPAPSNPSFIHHASVLFNGMVNPLIPYSIRGVIWYQGETNASRADQYRRLFPVMINDWRSRWGEGDIPFIFVQIAPLDAGPVDRAELRDAQREALSLNKTAMVVTVDIGMAKDEHPKNKQEVGRRLALAAEKLAYGKDVIASGPLYQRMAIEGDKIRLKFTEVAGGLSFRDSEVKGFTIAGADQQFHPAKVVIDGDTVVVSSESVSSPKAVRYAFANFPEYSLFNSARLPASPFRTDDWPLTTKGETKMFFEQMQLDETTMTPKPGEPANPKIQKTNPK